MTPGARLALALVVVLGLGAGAADASCDACVTAGAGRTAFALPPGTSLAGYGGFSRRLLLPDVLDLYPHAFWLKPSVGQRDPLAARALVKPLCLALCTLLCRSPDAAGEFRHSDMEGVIVQRGTTAPASRLPRRSGGNPCRA